MIFLRYAEFNKVVSNKIVETAMFFDIPHLMVQAGIKPFTSQTAAHLVQPGPRTHDGLLFEKQDEEEGKKTKLKITEVFHQSPQGAYRFFDTTSAINYLNKAIEFKPNYSEAFYNLGNTLTVKGDFRKAIKAFKKAIELKPDYFDALNNLGATYNLYKDYSNALKSISKALKIRPNIADAYNNLGTAELNLENENLKEIFFISSDERISDNT